MEEVVWVHVDFGPLPQDKQPYEQVAVHTVERTSLGEEAFIAVAALQKSFFSFPPFPTLSANQESYFSPAPLFFPGFPARQRQHG